MPIKSILVPLDGGEAGQYALAAAHRVAKSHSAHIEVFHVQADSKEAVPLLGEGMSGAMIEEMIDLADRDAAERSEAARRIYDEFRSANDIPVVEEGPAPEGASISWRQDVGREDEVVAYRGRRTDLTPPHRWVRPRRRARPRRHARASSGPECGHDGQSPHLRPPARAASRAAPPVETLIEPLEGSSHPEHTCLEPFVLKIHVREWVSQELVSN